MSTWISGVLGAVLLLACGGATSRSKGASVAVELEYIDKSAGDNAMTGVVLRPSWGDKVDLGTYTGVCTAKQWRRADAPTPNASRVVAGTLCGATTYVVVVWEGGNLVAYMNEARAGERPAPEVGWSVKGRVEVPAGVTDIQTVGD